MQDGPQPPKGALCWGCLTPGLACIARREPGMCFPADTDRSWGWCSRPRGPLLDPMLMSNSDYARALELMLVTRSPKQRSECCLLMVSSANSSPVYCMTSEYKDDQCDADSLIQFIVRLLLVLVIKTMENCIRFCGLRVIGLTYQIHFLCIIPY